MSAPKIRRKAERWAKREYKFDLIDAEPLVDWQGRRFLPRWLTITIGEDTLHAAVHGTHIKANGEIGVADRSASWYSHAGHRSRFDDGTMPDWVARELRACQESRPIYGPSWPEEWPSGEADE